jgi:hypothetical protein
MKQIPFYKNKKIAGYSLVDENVYEWAIKYKWHTDKNGYLTRSKLKSDGQDYKEKRLKYRLHRLVIGAPDGIMVDHINGDIYDNRLCNLRLASDLQNQFNKKKSKRNKTGYKGVSYRKNTNRYRAILGYQNMQFELGTFLTPEEAYFAYCKKSIEVKGEFVMKEEVEFYNNNKNKFET